MADTCVTQIVTAIAALMDATGAPTGLTVTASRVRPTASDAALKPTSTETEPIITMLSN